MDTANQFVVCCVCYLFGTVCAFFYDIVVWDSEIGAFSRLIVGKIVRAVLQIALLLAFSVAFVALSTVFSFPSVRLYMYAAILLGAFLYSKSWHRIVDFLKKLCYNIVVVKAIAPFGRRVRAVCRRTIARWKVKKASKRALRHRRRKKAKEVKKG